MTEQELELHCRDKGWQLTTDNDGHWYLIPAGFGDDFWKWVEWCENYNEGGNPSEFEYDRFALGGGPEGLTIFEYR